MLPTPARSDDMYSSDNNIKITNNVLKSKYLTENLITGYDVKQVPNINTAHKRNSKAFDILTKNKSLLSGGTTLNKSTIDLKNADLLITSRAREDRTPPPLQLNSQRE